MNKTSLISHVIAKGAIVLFFMSILTIFLYSPRIYELFFRKENVLTIYTPMEVFTDEMLEKFEKETGIHVRLTHFDTNEEMLAKFKISRGEGYDLVVPSDYMVELLSREGLLQKIDKSKIKKFTNIDKRLLGAPYDPQNTYSVPISWIPYGIGFNKKLFSLDNNVSWDLVFKKEVLRKYGDYKISMLNDAREAIFLTALHLFGTTKDLTDEQLYQVKDALIAQREIVEAYMEAGAKYLLLSDIVPLAVIPAARMKEMGDPEKFGFVIPKEGSLIDIMNLAIPVTSNKSEMAHKLIDFLLSKEVGAHHFNKLDCNPAGVDAYELIDPVYAKNKAFFPEGETFRRLQILHNEIEPSLLEKLWFLVKSAE